MNTENQFYINIFLKCVIMIHFEYFVHAITDP